MKINIIISFIAIICLSISPSFSQSMTPIFNEVLSTNLSGLTDEDNVFSDWIELYNPSDSQIDLTGYGLSDDLSNPFRWVFESGVINPGKFLLVFASGNDRRQPVIHWESVIDRGDEWHYFVGSSEPPSDWYTAGFDDSGWDTAPSGFGRDDGDDATEIPPTLSLYIRKTFNLNDIATISAGYVHIDYDDAFVAYINGVEIKRMNVTTSDGSPPAYDKSANVEREAKLYAGLNPQRITLQEIKTLLVDGENVLAFQIHNTTPESDMTAIPFLTLGMYIPPINERGVSEDLLDSFVTVYQHTNFKIDAAGETLVLTDSSGNIADTIDTGYIPNDYSLGRQPDSGTDWMLFSQPTPAKTNSTPGANEYASSVTVSVSGGFYDGDVTLVLHADTPDSMIRFTSDGSEPNQSDEIYSVPLILDKTTVIRTRMYVPGLLPGPVSTNTYIISEDYSIPVVSLATDPENLFSNETGIYVESNIWQDWERPVHVEFYEPDGTLGFNVDVGASIVGGQNRSYPKKSLALTTRSKYNSSSFDYQIFSGSPVTDYKAIILRNSGDDWALTNMRDAMMHGLVKDLDLDTMAYRPAILFINGDYWGIYNIREKTNEEYLANHHNVDPDNLDIIDPVAYYRPRENRDEMVIEGDAERYNEMFAYMETYDLSEDVNFEGIKDFMDVDNFIDYQVANIYFDNSDWPGNNIKLWRPKTPDGKFRWLLFDTDCGFGQNDGENDVDAFAHDTMSFAVNTENVEEPNPPWSTYMLRKLLENNSFRIDFVNCFADRLNTVFHPDLVVQKIRNIENVIAPEMPDHLERWGGTLDDWRNNVDFLEYFAENRVGPLRNYIADYFDLTGIAELSFDVSDQDAGNIRLNALIIDNYPWNGTYFRDIPISISAIPNPGYRFVGWSGFSNADTLSLTLTLEGNISLTALFEADSGTLDAVVMNEINYNSAPTFNSGDWVELYNNSSDPFDLSGWMFTDADDSHAFILPVDTILDPRGYLVLCQDTALFHSTFPEVSNYIGGFDFGLSGGGELLKLYTASAVLIDSLTYDINSPWPDEPDGSGSTLSLINPAINNAIPANWTASLPYGTPGASNAIAPVSHVVINEINYSSSAAFNPGDWVELYNNLSVSTDISGWVFKDSDNAHAFQIPENTTIEPYEYLVLCEDTSLFTSKFPNVYSFIGDIGFGLSGSGENLRLFDNDGELIDTVTYDNNTPWPEVADGGGATLSLINPVLDNEYAINWSSSVSHGTPGDINDVYTLGVDTGTEFYPPHEFSLGQNYPNPFNAVTTIPFSIASAGSVKIEVYSSLGQRVTDVCSEYFTAGYHTVTFNAEGLSAGIYFYYIKTEKFKKTGHMVYIK